MLAGFSGLAELAAHQRGLFPPPGPDLRAALRDALGVLDLRVRDVRVERRWTDAGGGLSGEELSWTVGFGPRTRAYLLRPRDTAGPLPGVVAMHCHAGMKWAGKEKIADGPRPPSAEVLRLRRRLYGGRAYACELARRGFAVLVHDVFAWGSRRPPLGRHRADDYDRAAREHEHVVAKVCAVLGTSFAGVLASEDLAAAAYLRSRPDIASVAAIGLSGGGARAALLGALDPGIGAVAVAAMVSSFRDLREEHVAAHSWMLFPPGLTRLADWPHVVACRAPGPLLVLYALDDPLFPEPGMRRAHALITEVYQDAPRGYTGLFFSAPHCFDIPMQEAAFAWLADRRAGPHEAEGVRSP
ncbi:MULTISPECIES: dienelactone hydrolase family protein [Thermomonospora]|uniref:Dienelactone hydrolase n=1 Tax=Thermomonospora cellulosilytica TaxID=1411118 RepID=A0A7W3R8C8_9ACTN|nr:MULTISPECIES: acetylesterase [Thermomonospora]MBA9004198.1 dienelactone hydrolase [Thermomonospora cellulosilytica]